MRFRGGTDRPDVGKVAEMGKKNVGKVAETSEKVLEKRQKRAKKCWKSGENMVSL